MTARTILQMRPHSSGPLTSTNSSVWAGYQGFGTGVSLEICRIIVHEEISHVIGRKAPIQAGTDFLLQSLSDSIDSMYLTEIYGPMTQCTLVRKSCLKMLVIIA